MKRELICIGCPMGCHLTAEVENGAVTSVTGNTCPRGDAYARRECVAPVRTVTGHRGRGPAGAAGPHQRRDPQDTGL